MYFDAELILFDGDDALHRADTIAHVFKGKYKDAKLKCHVFDIMRHESQTLTDEELEDRMTILFNNYSAKSNQAIAYPSKKDTRQADSLKDVEKYAQRNYGYAHIGRSSYQRCYFNILYRN